MIVLWDRFLVSAFFTNTILRTLLQSLFGLLQYKAFHARYLTPTKLPFHIINEKPLTSEHLIIDSRMGVFQNQVSSIQFDDNSRMQNAKQLLQ